MDCTDCEDHMDRHLDDELDPATRTAMDRHLEGCPRCAAELEELAALEAHYRADALPPPPDDLAATVQEALAPRPSRGPRWVHPLRLLAALGVVVAGFGLLRAYDDEVFEWLTPYATSGEERSAGQALFVVRQKLDLARYELHHGLLTRLDATLAAAERALARLPESRAVESYRDRIRHLRQQSYDSPSFESEEDASAHLGRASEAHREGDHRTAAFAYLDATLAYLQADRGESPASLESLRAALEELTAAHREGPPPWTEDFLETAWRRTSVPSVMDLTRFGNPLPEVGIPDIASDDHEAWDRWMEREPLWKPLLAPRPKDWVRSSREYQAELLHTARALAGRVRDPVARARLVTWVVRKRDLPEGLLTEGARLLEPAYLALRAAVREAPSPTAALLEALVEVATLRSACALRGLGPGDPLPGPARYADLLPVLEALPKEAYALLPGFLDLPPRGVYLDAERFPHPSEDNPARMHVLLSWSLLRPGPPPPRPAPTPGTPRLLGPPPGRPDAELVFALQERALGFLRTRFAEHPLRRRWEAEVLLERAEARADLLPQPVLPDDRAAAIFSRPGSTETAEEFRARVTPLWRDLVADLDAARSRLAGRGPRRWVRHYRRLHEHLGDLLAGARPPTEWSLSPPDPALRRTYWQGLRLPPPLGSEVPSGR